MPAGGAAVPRGARPVHLQPLRDRRGTRAPPDDQPLLARHVAPLLSAAVPRSRPGTGSMRGGCSPRCRIGGTAGPYADERSSALRVRGRAPQTLRCSSQPSGPFLNISASLSPFACRPSRMASTISSARQVSEGSRQTKATVTPSCSAMSVIDLAFPPSIRRQGAGSPRPIAISKPSGRPEPPLSPAARA